MCPTTAQQAQGPDWLEYAPASPIRPYYADLPRAEANTLISDFNQQGADPAAAAGARCLRPRRGEAVRAHPRRPARATRPSPAGSSRRTYPYYPPHAIEADRQHRDRASSAAARRPSGGPSPRSCAPTSSTAATPPARCWPCSRWPGWPARCRRAAPAGGSRRPASSPWPACCSSPSARGRAAGVRPVRVLLAVPAARAGHPGAGRRARDRRHRPLDQDLAGLSRPPRLSPGAVLFNGDGALLESWA